MKKSNILVSALLLAFATTGAFAQQITGSSSFSSATGGARILSTQGATAANPAIGFQSSVSTTTTAENDGGGGNGIFRPAANEMAFSTASTERMRITSGGAIGIGVLAPTAKFHTFGTVRFESLPISTTNTRILSTDANGNISTQLASSFFPSSISWLLGGNSGTNPLIDFLGTNDANPLNFRTSGTQRAIITAGGEMGIGTITPSAQLEVTSVPTILMETAIKGFGKSTGIYGEATDQTVGQTAASIIAGNKDAIGVFGKAIYIRDSGNGTTIGVAGSATATTPWNNLGTYGEAKNANGYNTGIFGVAGEFPVPSSTPGIYNTGVGGRVYENNTAQWNRAIYGAAPVLPKHFAGYFEGKVAIVDGTQANNFVLTSDATGLASWTDPTSIVSSSAWSLTGNAGINPASNFLGTTDAKPLIFKTSATEVARITAAGLTGFGTTNPLHKLQVHDGALMLSGNVAGFGGPQLLFTDDATTHPNGKWAIEYIKPIPGIPGTPGTRPSMGGLNFWKPFNSSNPPGLAYNYTLFLKDDGKVGMGVTDEHGDANFCAAALPNGYRLYVNGGILTTKVKVANYCSGAWADYVFAKDYKLKSLSEVEAFIKVNKHLPNIPSGDQIEKEGLDLAEMQAKQMEKIEELTLYMIEMKKEIDSLKKQNEVLKIQAPKN
jgi:hypothetical protein